MNIFISDYIAGILEGRMIRHFLFRSLQKKLVLNFYELAKSKFDNSLIRWYGQYKWEQLRITKVV